MFHNICEPVGKLIINGHEKMIQRHVCGTKNLMLNSLFQLFESQRMKEIGIELVRHSLCSFIALPLYCQEDERINHIFSLLSVNKLVNVNLNGTICKEKALDTKIVKFPLTRLLSRQMPVKGQRFTQNHGKLH